MPRLSQEDLQVQALQVLMTGEIESGNLTPATLDAFLGLTMAPRTTAAARLSNSVQVKAALLGKPKGLHPWVRCVSVRNNVALEVYGVDSVDKVYRVLTKHMTLGVSTSCCLQECPETI